MKTIQIVVVLALLHVSGFSQNILWFKQPARIWEEALPIGNGRLGAMVFGSVGYERVQLNEESLWTGSSGQSPDREDAYNYLPEVRRLLFEGKYAEAQEITERDMMAPGNWNMYQTLGDLYIQERHDKEITGYRRDLNLDSAIATVLYETAGISYKREYLSSPVDQVIVIRYTCSKSHNLSLSVKLTRAKDAKITAIGNKIIMHGQVTAGGLDIKGLNPGVKYETQVQATIENGKISISGDSLIIEKATTVTLYLSAATDYWGKDPHTVCGKTLLQATVKKYKALKNEHVAEHQRLFNRVAFNLGSGESTKLPTDERLKAFRNGMPDLQLLPLYFQYGRYLLICSSRPGDLAANLQGIWADGLVPPWSADYHININIQMNYWPAEVTNLAECHLPFIALTDSLRRFGRQTAKKMYNSRGFTAHFTTDVWYWTTATGKAEWGMWPMGAAWCCQHLWEHYAYGGDKEFLAYAYPILKEASEFFIDYLTTNPKTGYLVTGPSSSPENKLRTSDGKISNITMGPTMDMEIIWDLFSNTIEASKILSIDYAFRNLLAETRAKLSPLKIGSDGRLMEWTEEFEEPEPGHRHISHLFGLYPGNQISLTQTPELADAARKSLEYRLSHGGGHTGWSRAWIINYFARLADGEKAYENLVALLQKSTLDNLFDNHPPFQIDGNFGGTAGIAEMLVQSHSGEMHILPALPKAWPNGSVKGLCVRGGFEVDIAWEHGQLKKLKVISRLGNPLKIRNNNKVLVKATKAGASYAFEEW